MRRNDFQKSLKIIKSHIVECEKDEKINLPTLNTQISEQNCSCEDIHGNHKNLYPSQKDAQQEIKYLLETKSLKLYIYPCPHEKGWHLTKG